MADDDERCGHIQQAADHGHPAVAGRPAREEEAQDCDRGRDDEDGGGDLADANAGAELDAFLAWADEFYLRAHHRSAALLDPATIDTPRIHWR